MVNLSLINLLPNLYIGIVHLYVYIQAKDANLNSSSFTKKRNTPYIPQQNCMFERTGITLQQMLAIFVYPIHYTLEDYLHYLTSAYRISVQEGTKWTLNCIIFGRETLLLPIDVESPINIDEPPCPVLHVDKVDKVMQSSFQYVQERLRCNSVNPKNKNCLL